MPAGSDAFCFAVYKQSMLLLLCFKNCLFSPRVHVALLEKMNVLQRGVWPLIDEEDIIEIEDYGY